MYVLRCICTFATLALGHFQLEKINPSLALSGILHGVTFVLNISNLLGLSPSMFP